MGFSMYTEPETAKVTAACRGASVVMETFDLLSEKIQHLRSFQVLWPPKILQLVEEKSTSGVKVEKTVEHPLIS